MLKYTLIIQEISLQIIAPNFVTNLIKIQKMRTVFNPDINGLI